MTYPISLNQQPKQAQNLKQTQRLIMSAQMQQAIQLLQMPILELSAALEEELQQNPLMECEELKTTKIEEEQAEEPQDMDQIPEKELDFNEKDYEILKRLDEDFRDHFSDQSSYSTHRSKDEDKLKTYQENSICSESSLFEYLMQQARENFSNTEDLSMAEVIIGNFDENGFLTTSLEEIGLLNNYATERLKELLKQIQTFDPHGVGASTMQESLLIQLRNQQKQHTLAYEIIEKHYEDLIYNRIPVIKKNLSCTPEEIHLAFKKDINRLDLHPGFSHYKQFIQYITPDASVEADDNILTIKVNEEDLPSIRINRRYLRMLEDEALAPETKEFILQKLASAKWLMRNIHQRNETLLKILEILIKVDQEYFLDPQGKLHPLTMKAVAEQLNLHESTIARAVANKYIDTPRGILPLRSFFTNALANKQGEDVSPDTVKHLLNELIQSEDKENPLSDAELSELLSAKGLTCARRTVAKYRIELNQGNAQQRRKYK